VAIVKTSALQIAYCDTSTQLNQLADVTQQAAQTIEAALLTRGVAPADVSALIAAGWFTDTGEVTIGQVSTAYAINATPTVRRIGKRAQATGGWANAGSGKTTLAATTSYTVVAAGGIPADCRPPQNRYCPAISSAPAAEARFVIGADGSITLLTGATVGSYYRLDSCDWFTA
jgi:hypothetical protein